MSMYELTKKMPAASQHIVRRKVFLTVLQEEVRLLNITEPTFNPGVGTGDSSHHAGYWSNWTRELSCFNKLFRATSFLLLWRDGGFS
ncbi:hypothetical protein B7P43_G11361 [Cryptotermes secundus]|uniref:Uncharacterized protein n=1 Tax=Cryptotermes secundus TaxID=105785 RepID=A0A2J7QTA6_9NEOP|nr:hypothetical protein B7P43_G11361 [Cryptotermes secundus]